MAATESVQTLSMAWEPASSGSCFPPSVPTFLVGHYVLDVSCAFKSPLEPREASLSVHISIDTTLPDLDLYDPRSHEAQWEAFLSTGHPLLHTLRRYTALADRLTEQIRNAFAIPPDYRITLTLPGMNDCQITPVKVVASLAEHLRRHPTQPDPRRAQLLREDTDQIMVQVQAPTPIALLPRNTYTVHITLLSPHGPIASKTLRIELPQTARGTKVTQLISKVAYSVGLGEDAEKGDVSVVLSWAGKELLPQCMISQDMFVQDGSEGRRLELTAKLERVAGTRVATTPGAKRMRA